MTSWGPLIRARLSCACAYPPRRSLSQGVPETSHATKGIHATLLDNFLQNHSGHATAAYAVLDWTGFRMSLFDATQDSASIPVCDLEWEGDLSVLDLVKLVKHSASKCDIVALEIRRGRRHGCSIDDGHGIGWPMYGLLAEHAAVRHVPKVCARTYDPYSCKPQCSPAVGQHVHTCTRHNVPAGKKYQAIGNPEANC